MHLLTRLLRLGVGQRRQPIDEGRSGRRLGRAGFPGRRNQGEQNMKKGLPNRKSRVTLSPCPPPRPLVSHPSASPRLRATPRARRFRHPRTATFGTIRRRGAGVAAPLNFLSFAPPEARSSATQPVNFVNFVNFPVDPANRSTA